MLYVACGSRDAHTIAASENNVLWAWGDAKFGKLGIPDKKTGCVTVTTPVQVMAFNSGIVQLECGMQFSVVLTKDGKIHTWYMNHYCVY